MLPEYDIQGRVWRGGGLGVELMQRTQGASSSGQCKLQGGPRPPGTWRGRGVWEPRLTVAPGEAPPGATMHKSRLMRSGLRRGCSERPPSWRLLSAPSLVSSVVLESLHRLELLPCWSAAGWRPPASCGGYRRPWTLEPPSWVGGCPSNWVASASEAGGVALELGVLFRVPWGLGRPFFWG